MKSRPEQGASPWSRRSYIDWARGLGVLVMIHAHVLDAWTTSSERTSAAFGYLNLLAGFAAPLFLWLAGLSVVLAGERGLDRGLGRHEAGAAVVRRGLQIFLLAFAFRLQAFLVSPGNPWVSLLRVDILNIMGPSIVLAATIWWVSPRLRVAAAGLGVVSAAIALATPMVRTAAWVGHLPPLVQWYLTPSGHHSTFTLFPWAGFVFAGGVTGALLAGVARTNERLANLRVALAGLALVIVCYGLAYRPSIYAASSFWTTSPTYFGVRVGILMLLLAALSAMTPLAARTRAAARLLTRLGRHSLFIYWIHVELVYGYATVWLHRRLPLWGTGLAFVAFCCALYASIGLRDRVVAWWHRQRDEAAAPRQLHVDTTA